MKITIVTPVLNEEKNITEFYKRISKTLKTDFTNWDYEIIFIDDGSTDMTFKKLQFLHKEHKKIKIIQFSKNFGQHTAILAGLQFATGDYIAVMDSDLQDRPEEVVNLYKKIIQGYNIVYSVRQNYTVPFFKKVSSILFWRLLGFLTGYSITADQSMLKIFDRKVLAAINKQKYISSPFLPVIFAKIGMKEATVTVKNDKRFTGESKYNVIKMISLMWLILYAYSSRRLFFLYISAAVFIQLVTILGLLYLRFSKSLTGLTNYSLIILQIILLFFTFGIIYSMKKYFINLEKNSLEEPDYIIRKKLLT